ncbi:putative bifunctional diguanylate cyclase/phosphodiesterase [Sphingosinicella sp.]|uniref:putative bifunctional diguanylate cyclase/phosphodiesterase n=1 Tax=Sphingosinicella sp. TaxID=1917971 RepID=UPI0035B28165
MHGSSLSAPVFLASFRYRREAQDAIEATGRPVIVSLRPDDAARRYAASEALIAIVDARGALQRGLQQVEQLSQAVQERRGGLLVLLSRSDAASLGDVYTAGATHYLISPFGASELGQSLRFVERSIRRMQKTSAEAAVASAQASIGGTARWEWSVGDDSVRISPALAVLIGDPPHTDQLSLDDAFLRLDRRARAQARRAVRRIWQAGVPGEVEHRLVLDGRPHTYVHHIRPTRDAAGSVLGLTATVEDLDSTLIERRLSAHFDTLTGLANLRHARAWVDEKLNTRAGHNPACIVVMFAISRFDQVNAAYGRAVADSLLQAVGRRLRRLLNDQTAESELPARLGGAEFAVAFAGPITLNQAVFFSQRIGKGFEKPFIVGGRVIHLSCRIGIAASDEEVTTADELFQRASAALSSAKELDPNSFQVFLSDEHGNPARFASLEADLRAAAERRGLSLLYQPQVDIVTNRIVGVEALVRWEHPLYGVLPAETLFAIAERAEFGTRLGEQIMRQACGEAAAWPAHLRDLRLSINVTAADMRAPDFERIVAESLADSHFPPSRLTLEVTEGGLVEDLEHASEILSKLRQRGISVAIDDFGTGYSSLAYLKSLPLDILKVDKKLVTDLSGSTRDRVIVRGVVDMARSLGMVVVAEGVESESQLETLVREGCNWYQGYLCSPPLALGDLPPFVENWQRARAA